MGEKARNTELQRLAQALLEAPLGAEDALRQELEARGVEPTGAGALLYAQWKQALKGDLKAASFLGELAGEAEEEKLDLRALSDAELLRLLRGASDADAR